jgi:polyisoprenoid-binding protein YceI
MRLSPHISYLLLISLAAAPLHAGNYQIDKTQSELAADMHATPSHRFTSVAQDYTYDIEINPETLEVEKARCSFKFADLDSGKSSRDSKMCKWMNIEKYPEATFELTEQLPDNVEDARVAKGTFTMHGMTRPITIAYTVHRENGQVILDGHSEFDHGDWGLEQVRLFFFSVDTLLKPHFHLVGTLQQ